MVAPFIDPANEGDPQPELMSSSISQLNEQKFIRAFHDKGS